MKKGIVKWFDTLKGIGEVYCKETKSMYFVVFRFGEEKGTQQINSGFWNLKENESISFNNNDQGLITEYLKDET